MICEYCKENKVGWLSKKLGARLCGKCEYALMIALKQSDKERMQNEKMIHKHKVMHFKKMIDEGKIDEEGNFKNK